VRNAAANFGDYKNTADRPAEFYPVTGDWEAIPTTNESYGYHKFDNSHKPASFFIQLLARAAAKGGNLLMNIGPRGDGTFDPKDLAILDGIGKWMDKNSESIYDVRPGPLPVQSWGVSTRQNKKIYLHVFEWPADGKLYVGGLSGPIDQIYLLSDKTKKLNHTALNGMDVLIAVPAKAPDSNNSVIVVECESSTQADAPRYLAPNIKTHRLLAFDAKQEGKGFSYGDGKAGRYYVENWKSAGQLLSWMVRTEAPLSLTVEMTYILPDDAGGIVQLQCGEHTKNIILDAGKGERGKVITKEVDALSLTPGLHEIRLRPVEVGKTELMKLLEIKLINIALKN
jgi:hypothetical protein